jgi:crotonobetaine/carnitine-CoA ligase
MPHFLLKQPEKPNDRDNKVWRVNSAACPRELIRAFEERFGVNVYEGYGAVDGGGFMLGSFGHESIPVGTMGRPPEGTIAEIMDDDGNLLGCDETGELVFLVKQEELQQRQVVYYKDEGASKSRMQEAPDGRTWFHTGDLAEKDEDGWFYFVDRKKDAIRRRGENIAAWSIERTVNQHDKVLESAAYGVKSAEYGEDEVMVAVVLKPEESMTPEELLDFCQDKMADFMIPRFVDFIDKLPKSEVHRIMKRFLKDRGVTETTYDREKAGYQIKR